MHTLDSFVLSLPCIIHLLNPVICYEAMNFSIHSRNAYHKVTRLLIIASSQYMHYHHLVLLEAYTHMLCSCLLFRVLVLLVPILS